MNAPEAVVFDLGKVLLDFDYSIAVRKLQAKARLNNAAIAEFLLQTSAIVDFESGLITDREFYAAICDATGYGGSFEEFGASFRDIFMPIEPMIAWQSSLRARRVPTFIFSNTNTLAVDYIRETYPFFREFDGYILSYEHGCMKPQTRIYEVVEQVTGLKGDRLLYLDDRAENVEAGAARGWHTILHQAPAESLARARALGL